MSLTTSDIVILVVGTALTFMTVILVIWEAEKQMYMFGLRPSESVATDMGGFITLSKGIPGNFRIEYKPQLTENIVYNVTIKNKIVCVSSFTRYWVSDCSSTAFDVGGPYKARNATITLIIKKELPLIEVELIEEAGVPL